MSAAPEPPNSDWLQYLEQKAADDELDRASLEALVEELSQLTEQPCNLNAITKADLDKLPFLNDLQVENLLYYVYRYAPLASIYELKNVEGLDMQTIACLLPFVYVGDYQPEKSPSARKRLPRIRQEITTRSDRTLQRKAGYANGKYVGDPQYLNLRYGLSAKNLQAGFSAEKDAGEQLWARRRGPDYFTYNLLLKNRGVLEALHVGNYRLSFAQGLVMNTHFSMGKSTDVTNTGLRTEGIHRHVSMSEAAYFSGLATALKWKQLRTKVFCSRRSQDATGNDSMIFSFKTDGYHRTQSDLDKRDRARTELAGSRFEWDKDALSVGATAVYYRFGGKTLDPKPKAYNTFYLRGREHYNLGVDYHYRRRKSLWQGELAIDRNGKVAAVQHVLWQPLSWLEGAAAMRYYDKEYNALYGRAFSEGTTVQNETGAYGGLKIRLPRAWEVSTYVDWFRFPWQKYGIDTPSSGVDGLLQVSYNPLQPWKMAVRYRHKQKQSGLLPAKQERLRYQFDWEPSRKWRLKTQADYSRYALGGTAKQGWSVLQAATCVPSARFQVDAGLAYFQTDDWNTRISLYEKSVLYAFSFTTMSGRGIRYFAVAKWQITKPLTLYFKAGSSHCFDRDMISSGNEAINGHEKTDICLQVKCRF